MFMHWPTVRREVTTLRPSWPHVRRRVTALRLFLAALWGAGATLLRALSERVHRGRWVAARRVALRGVQHLIVVQLRRALARHQSGLDPDDDQIEQDVENPHP